jgi:hypothetical protein
MKVEDGKVQIRVHDGVVAEAGLTEDGRWEVHPEPLEIAGPSLTDTLQGRRGDVHHGPPANQDAKRGAMTRAEGRFPHLAEGARRPARTGNSVQIGQAGAD